MYTYYIHYVVYYYYARAGCLVKPLTAKVGR